MSFPCLLPIQSSAAVVHAGSSSCSAAAHTALCHKVMDRLYPSCLLAHYSLSIQFPKPSTGHRRKSSLLYPLSVFPKPPIERGEQLLPPNPGKQQAGRQAFQRERKKLTKVEEEIQWTRSSQWRGAAGNWEPIRVHGRREPVLPSNAPRKSLHPRSNSNGVRPDFTCHTIKLKIIKTHLRHLSVISYCQCFWHLAILSVTQTTTNLGF